MIHPNKCENFIIGCTVGFPAILDQRQSLGKTVVSHLKAAKNETQHPQLVAQHCFVEGFGRCFPFFTWRDQLGPQQKHLLRVEEMRRADWLICSGTSKSCEFDEKRATKPKFVAHSRSALYFSQQLSSTRSKYFCCASVSLTAVSGHLYSLCTAAPQKKSISFEGRGGCT